MDFIERDGRIYKIILQEIDLPEINRLFEDNVTELPADPIEGSKDRIVTMGYKGLIYEMLLPVGMKIVYMDDIFGILNYIGFLKDRTPYPLIKETEDEENEYMRYRLEILSTPVEPMEFYELMRLQSRLYLSPYLPIMIMKDTDSYCIGLPHADTYALPNIYRSDDRSLQHSIDEYVFDTNEMYTGRDPIEVLLETSRPYPILIYVLHGQTPEDNIYYPWKPLYENAIYLLDIVVSGIVCFDQSSWNSLYELKRYIEPYRFIRSGPIYSISDVDIF